MSVQEPKVPRHKGIYKPLNDLKQPWLAGQLTMEDGIIVPVFYVGDNGHRVFGKYNGKVSWFSHALKDLIGKEGDCVKLGDTCLNGVPLFIRENESGDKYISTDDDVISLVVKKNGDNANHYTIKNLPDDKGFKVIPEIDKSIPSITVHKTSFPIDYPYYNKHHVETLYSQLQQTLSKSCIHDNLCNMFNKRRENLDTTNEVPVFLGGTRRKKKTKRAKRAKRAKRTRRH